MTDSSSFANALSEPLRQPFWWAALASISLHGTLGASAPTISNLIYGGNSSKNGPGSVGLIELTPTEMGRLPQTIPPRPANSRFAIAPVPFSPNSKLVSPLPPPEPSVINLPAMPPGMPPPGFFSPLPLPSPSLTAPPPPNTSSPTLKTPPQKQQIIIPQQPPSPPLIVFDPIIPPPPPSPSLGESPQIPGQAGEDEAETLKKIIASRGGLPLFPDGAPVFTPEFPIGDSNSGANGIPKLTQKDPNKRRQIPDTPEELARRQQFEENNRNLQQGQSGSNLSGDQQAMLDSGNQYVALFNEFKRAYPDLEMTGPTPVNVTYPPAACSQQLQGVAVLGAVVNPLGAIVASPRTIVPTSSSILNKAAETAIINPSLRFSPTSTHKLYQLAVEFKYDPKICSGVPPAPRSVPAEPKPAGQQLTPATPTEPTEVKPQFEKPAAVPNKPQPGATQSPPSPQPQPAAPQSPSPQPQPAATQSPAPQPRPAAPQPPPPEVTPTPATEPSPSPEVVPTPAAEPSPSPEVSPTPATEPSPSPEVSPTPATEPSASPEPSPAATQN
jgi:hypothetical protein